MNTNASISKTGKGTGSLQILGTTFEGQCNIYSDSSEPICINTPKIANNFTFKNISSNSWIQIRKGWTQEPNSTLIFKDTSKKTTSLTNHGEALKTYNGTIFVSGEGHGTIGLIGAFGGTINIINDGTTGELSLRNGKTDWNEETIRFKIIPKSYTEIYNNILTQKIGKNLDIESTYNTNLNGSFDNNTKIRITGEKNWGTIHLNGNYTGLISLNFESTPNSSLVLYNNNIKNLKCNIKNNASNITIYATTKLGKNVTINNESKYPIRIQNNQIGDNSIINISEKQNSTFYITEDIPAGTTVNY